MSNLLRLPEPARTRLREAVHARFPLWFNRSQRFRRWVRRLFFAVAFYVVGSSPAWAKDHWSSSAGVGNLITVPDLAHGRGKTLYESYSLGRYQIYTDLSWHDVAKSGAAILYQMFEWGALFLGKLAVGLTWWQVQLTGNESGLGTIGQGMQNAAVTLNKWLLPSALAIGLSLAYIMARRGEDFFGQAAKCIGCAVLAVGIGLSGAQMAKYADQGRTMLSNEINRAGGSAVSTSDMPFKQPGTDVHSGDAASNAARAQGDAVWRVLVVVPWCQVQFGQQDVCKATGHQWLSYAHVKERKENVLDRRIKNGENGDSVVSYVKGNNPADRLIGSIIAFLTAGVGCIILGGLALMAIMPWILVVLLLFAAVVFACLACIPKLRPISAEYANTLFGLTLTSAMNSTILTGMLMALLAGSTITTGKGWLPGLLFTFACMGGAWVARKKLEQILTGSSGGHGMGMMASMIGGRMLTRGIGRMAGAVGRSKPGRAIGRGARGAGRLAGRGAKGAGRFASAPARAAGRGSRRAFMARTKPQRAQARAWGNHLKDTAAQAKAWPGQKLREATQPRRDAKEQMRQEWSEHKMDQRRAKLADRDERKFGTGRFESIRYGGHQPGRGPGSTRKNTRPSTRPTPPRPEGGHRGSSGPKVDLRKHSDEGSRRRGSIDRTPRPAFTAPPRPRVDPEGIQGASAQLNRVRSRHASTSATQGIPQRQQRPTQDRAGRREDVQPQPIRQQRRRSATRQAEDVQPGRRSGRRGRRGE